MEWFIKGGMEIINGILGGEFYILQLNIVNLNLDKIKVDLNKFYLKFDFFISKWWSDFIE